MDIVSHFFSFWTGRTAKHEAWKSQEKCNKWCRNFCMLWFWCTLSKGKVINSQYFANEILTREGHKVCFGTLHFSWFESTQKLLFSIWWFYFYSSYFNEHHLNKKFSNCSIRRYGPILWPPHTRTPEFQNDYMQWEFGNNVFRQTNGTTNEDKIEMVCKNLEIVYVF